MSEFNRLREMAKQRFDKAVLVARSEYEAALTSIASVELQLTAEARADKKPQPIVSYVQRVMPRDRSFTITDIVTSLRALEPNHLWELRQIQSSISQLMARKVIRRLRRPSNGGPAVYSLPDVPSVVLTQLSNKTLHQAIQHVLTRPMLIGEIAVALVEGGYPSKMTMRKLAGHVSRALQAGKFKQADGKWLAQ